MREFLLNILLAVDQNIFEFIKIPQDSHLSSNKKSLKELSKILKRGKEKNIFIGILGSWALTMYSNKEFKNIDDIDLLTNDVSSLALKEILLELGYEEGVSKWSNMDYFEKDGIGIDMYSIDNKKHVYYGLPFEIEEIEYKGVKYPVLSKEALYKMYKKVFMRPKRSVKKDLVKFKILRNIKD